MHEIQRRRAREGEEKKTGDSGVREDIIIIYIRAANCQLTIDTLQQCHIL